MVGLLMLATLLVYAVPSHAGLAAHHPSNPAHEHVLADTHDHAVAAAADHGDEQAPCKDPGLLDGDACCSVAQCATMHGGLPASAAVAFIPRLDTSAHLPALATPEGIGSDPALRPPCLTI